ncbi:leader peptidase [Vibrio variabilis]|uniref:Leader peptidase n=1 Tax=Vibrio variabilis TaxID=990271 RepID=A0ABQ0J544_9VIBR|nr:leader peptidase [Vibrio variabilis]
MPRSACPKCKTPIRILDNIPVLSWLLLKGHCRHCDNKISSRYPLVELLTAAMCGIVAWYLGFSWYSIALIGMTLVLISATFIDLDTMLLPDQLTVPLLWVGVALALLGISPTSLQDSVIGASRVIYAFGLCTGCSS